MAMKNLTLTCAISGVKLGTFDTQLNSLAVWHDVKALAICHPMFLQDPYALAKQLTADWWEESSNYQRQLWLLAALHHLDVLIVRKPQLPPSLYARNNFPERVAALLLWAQDRILRRVNLPKLVLDDASDKDSWPQFRGWLAACEQIYSDWMTGVRMSARRRKRMEGSKRLVHQIQLHATGYRKSMPLQLLWNFACADIPDGLLHKNVRREVGIGKFETRTNEEWWQDMFCHPRIQDDVRFVRQDVEELEEVIYSYLDENFLGSSQSTAVTKRLKELAAAYQITEDSFRIISGEDTMNATATEIQASVQMKATVEQWVANGISEPKREDYPTQLAFLVASAKWKMVQAISKATDTEGDL